MEKRFNENGRLFDAYSIEPLAYVPSLIYLNSLKSSELARWADDAI